jgi:guanine nucleotide-binding protein subunit alpha
MKVKNFTLTLSVQIVILYKVLYFNIILGADKDVDSAARFIQRMFQEQSLLPGKVIYPHFTTATDTSNIQVVFQVVMDTILRENLRSASIL